MKRSRLVRALFLLGWMVMAGIVYAQSDEPLRLILPTSNDALFSDDGPSFYQYTDRSFLGTHTRPWQGGMFGYVRNPERTAQGIIFTRFHEGIDIRPLFRDARGEPLDTIRVIDDGRVVHVNDQTRHSSYGKYVVVEHWWSESPFYSLYAHLSRVDVREGQWVLQGERLGRMGYTGTGVNRRRAHVHFEINMLVNQHFQIWHDSYYDTPNWHKIYNGLNLVGLDVAGLYLALRHNPSLTIEAFVTKQPHYYKVIVPNKGIPDLIYRYSWLSSLRHPWLTRYRDNQRVKSWEISFTQSGLPIRVEPSGREVSEATASMVSPASISYSDLTNGIIAGSGASFRLSRKGDRYVDLFTTIDESQASIIDGRGDRETVPGREQRAVGGYTPDQRETRGGNR